MIRFESGGMNDEGGIDMSQKGVRRTVHHNRLMAAVMGLLLVSLGGCAGEAPRPASSMAQDQVRSNADKAFDKLKQEEKNRAPGSDAAPY